ncbi:hypothetical protein [Ureibacillus manganicus]|uniref:Uncharacterized protein n=1 Tax=Ureibacillus manganicus DSM 26584 TaxID=1384049 RepID=A0A0A3INI2_9BACL|nr:hypothetical protein [Ureibacillus manganicus]KGR76397.1 hypothetical protein CD29_16845 [Ureibacillus manganicus DSM 26584]
MTVKQLENAIDRISAVEGVRMEPMYLKLDVLALYYVYRDRFDMVVQEIINVMEKIVDNPSLGEQLEYSLKEYKSYHFSSPGQTVKPQEEDMRLAHRF